MKSPEIQTMHGWKPTTTQVFWGEIAPCDHVVQIYDNDESFMDLLAGFVEDGFNSKDCVIIIATSPHIYSLNSRLVKSGFDLHALDESGQYVVLDASETLAKFMVNDWPDENLFVQVITDLLQKARKENRRVRAFGEMVAALWAKGQVGATLRLEQLWNKLCENEAFSLFCAYPKDGFVQDANESLMHICKAHSKMIIPSGKSPVPLLYKNTDQIL